MPTEDLTYRVNLDTSQLSGQLENLKSQIDLAAGGTSFSNIGSEELMPLPGAVENIPGLAIDPFTNMGETGLLETLTGGLSQAWHNVAEAGQAGYHKFNEGLDTYRNAQPSNTVPRIYGSDTGYSPDMMSGPERFQQMQIEMEGRGIWGRMGVKAFGMGWNPDDPMSSREYSNMANQELPPGAPGTFISSLLSMGISEVAGSIAGVAATPYVGPWGGLGVNMATTLAVDAVISKPLGMLLGPDKDEVLNYQRAKFFQNQSRAGKRIDLSFDEAKGTADIVDTFMGSTEAFMHNYSETEMNDALSTFDTSGGLSMVSNAQEYRSKISSFLDSHREVMQILRMSSQEAAAFMGEMNGMGLTGDAGTATAVSLQLSSAGSTLGYTPAETMSVIARGRELVRGSGIDMSGAGADLLSTTLGLTRSVQEGTLSGSVIAHAGGIEQAAAMKLKAGYNYSQSVPGQIGMLAAVGAGSFGEVGKMGFSEMMQTAMGQIGDMGDILTYFGTTDDIASAAGSEYFNTLEAGNHARLLTELMGRPATSEEFEGFLVNQPGIDRVQAKLMVGEMTKDTGAMRASAEEDYNESMNALYELRPTWGGQQIGKFKKNLNEVGYMTGQTFGVLMGGLGSKSGRALWKDFFKFTGDAQIVRDWGRELRDWNKGGVDLTGYALEGTNLELYKDVVAKKIDVEEIASNETVRDLWAISHLDAAGVDARFKDVDEKLFDKVFDQTSDWGLAKEGDLVKKVESIEDMLRNDDEYSNMTEDEIKEMALKAAITGSTPNEDDYLRRTAKKLVTKVNLDPIKKAKRELDRVSDEIDRELENTGQVRRIKSLRILKSVDRELIEDYVKGVDNGLEEAVKEEIAEKYAPSKRPKDMGHWSVSKETWTEAREDLLQNLTDLTAARDMDDSKLGNLTKEYISIQKGLAEVSPEMRQEQTEKMYEASKTLEELKQKKFAQADMVENYAGMITGSRDSSTVLNSSMHDLMIKITALINAIENSSSSGNVRKTGFMEVIRNLG